MISPLPHYLAESHEPLFSNQFFAVGVLLIGIAALIMAVAVVIRWFGGPRPNVPPKAMVPPTATVPPATIVTNEPSGETLAIIAACVAVICGKNARIASVRPVGLPIDGPMQQWSLEGRRQVYSSHQVR